VVSLSGGLSSAVAAERVLRRYGREAVALWFADTAREDEDLYRFVEDLEGRWGVGIVRYRDGRTPLEVTESRRCIPNNRMAYCSEELKVRPFARWLKRQAKPLTVHLGLDWTELDRMEKPRRSYQRIPGVVVDFPLMWGPMEGRPYGDVVGEWGISIPRLYLAGFPHNNCGERCVRQGQGEWARLLCHFPERFAEVEAWETRQREQPHLGRYAICRRRLRRVTRALPLAEVRAQAEPRGSAPPSLRPPRSEAPLGLGGEVRSTPGDEQLPLFVEDRFACFCRY
jgi:hypothetical protein